MPVRFHAFKNCGALFKLYMVQTSQAKKLREILQKAEKQITMSLQGQKDGKEPPTWLYEIIRPMILCSFK